MISILHDDHNILYLFAFLLHEERTFSSVIVWFFSLSYLIMYTDINILLSLIQIYVEILHTSMLNKNPFPYTQVTITKNYANKLADTAQTI